MGLIKLHTYSRTKEKLSPSASPLGYDQGKNKY